MRSNQRAILNAISGIALFLFGAISAHSQSDAEEAFYLERYHRAEAARATRNFTAIYDIMAPLKGAQTVMPLPIAETSPIDQETLAQARDYVAQRNTKALIILSGGEVIFSEYFGGAGPDTPLVAKSLAKPLSVIAVGRAIEEGFIDGLGQPLSTVFKAWQDTPKEDMTVYHLLSMRSGLKRQSRYSGPEDVMRRAYLHPRHDEIIIREYPLLYPPGTRYDYSNANGELVAPLIERTTSQRYEDWVTQEVLGPLGAAGGSIWLNREGGTAHSSCCSLLPAQSWVKFALLVAQQGQWEGKQLLDPAFVRAMVTPTEQNPFVGMAVYNGRTYRQYRGAQNPDQGGGTFHSAPYLATDTLLFDGNGNQVIYIIPSQDLIIARFGDTPPKGLAWDNAYLPNLLVGSLLKKDR